MRIFLWALVLAGLAGIVFGFWGIYTPEGRAQYDEMDGIYPYLGAFCGALALGLAGLLAIVRSFRARRRPTAEQPVAAEVAPDADLKGRPSFTRYAHYPLMAIPVLLYLLFQILCSVTLGDDAHIVIGYWFEFGSDQWLMSGFLVVFVFVYALLLVNFLSVFYALYFGVEKTYVPLGLDLYNGIFFYDFFDSARRPIATAGALYDQRKWFFDRFSDLQKETVIQYGHRPQDVLNFKAFGVTSAVLAVLVQWILLFVIILIAFSVLGTWLDEIVLPPEAARGESPFVTTLLWLWRDYEAGAWLCVALFLGLSAFAVFITYWKQSFLQEKLKKQPLEKLPDRIAPGENIKGEITDYAIMSRSTGRHLGRKSTHYNLLVKFRNIYEVPVWLRLSLMDEEKNRTWMEGVKGQSGLKQFFTVQEDLSIWPDDLASDDSV